jgi:dihydrofolate reductase
LRRIVLQMCVTLDGFADGEFRIVPEFDSPYWKEIDAELSKSPAAEVDTILMGRGTYEEFASYWPTAGRDPSDSASLREGARFLNETPKVVFSNSLTHADWAGTRIVRGDLVPEIERLKRAPGQNLIVPGGVRFPRSLIEHGLVDDYLLTVVPMLMGSGVDRLFGNHVRPQNLTLVRARPFATGEVLQHYVLRS